MDDPLIAVMGGSTYQDFLGLCGSLVVFGCADFMEESRSGKSDALDRL